MTCEKDVGMGLCTFNFVFRLSLHLVCSLFGTSSLHLFFIDFINKCRMQHEATILGTLSTFIFYFARCHHRAFNIPDAFSDTIYMPLRAYNYNASLLSQWMWKRLHYPCRQNDNSNHPQEKWVYDHSVDVSSLHYYFVCSFPM